MDSGFLQPKVFGEIPVAPNVAPNGEDKYTYGAGEMCNFRQITPLSRNGTRYVLPCIVSMKGEQEVVCALLNGDIADDLE